jgi:hypothetical protein
MSITTSFTKLTIFLTPETLIKIFLGSEERLVRGTDNLTAIYDPVV